MKRLLLSVLVLLVLLALSAGAAQARGGDGREARVAGDCARGATSSLRLRARDHGIEVRFRLRQTRGHGLWRVAVVHEDRVAARATSRTTRSDDSFEVRRRLPDLQGSDTVTVHAWGPRGLGCRATATLSR
ncbi:MAG TPA: hypothetical protein VFV91_13875 [Gaiellaceae bacterium]|nr:hypothetical protein [Gaiellaceae bacterium]